MLKKTFLILSILCFSSHSFAIRLDKQSFLNMQRAVFEVVKPLTFDAPNLQYKEKFSYDLLPHYLKKDKTSSFGTAFAISSTELVSAAHVFDVHRQSSYFKDIRVKDHQGNLYEIDSVKKLSQQEDYIVFTLKSYPKNMHALKTAPLPDIGDGVSAVGNALGQGIVERDGRVSSYTTEEIDGKWKYIRFTAPASPGNSGGPLVNDKGHVVGIVVKKSQDENLNYAVPIELIAQDNGQLAKFHDRNLIESESGQKLFTPWKETFKLPANIYKLSDKSSKAFVEGIKKRRKDFEKKFAKDIFPGHPNIEGYLRVQSNSSQFVTVEKDSGEFWEGQVYVKLDSASVSEDQNIYFGVGNKNMGSMRMEVYIEKPNNVSLKKFIGTPKIYFDTFVQSYGFQMSLAEQSNQVLSFGEPVQVEKWKDQYGRNWTTAFWSYSPFDIILTSHCLPSVRGVACEIKSNPTWASKFETFYQKTNAKRMALNYYGTVGQWKEFLKLPKSMLPESLKTFKINNKSGQLQLAKNGLSLKIPKRISDQDFIELKAKHALDLSHEDITSIIFEPKSQKAAGNFLVERIYEASPKNTKKSKDVLNKIFKRKYPFDAGVYKGKTNYYRLFVKKDPQGPSKKAKSVVSFECEIQQNNGKKFAKKTCEKFKKLNGI